MRHTSCCLQSAAGSANCKRIVGDQGDLCVNEASNMTQQLAAELRQLFAAHGTIQGFQIACPLSDSLDGGASQYETPHMLYTDSFVACNPGY